MNRVLHGILAKTLLIPSRDLGNLNLPQSFPESHTTAMKFKAFLLLPGALLLVGGTPLSANPNQIVAQTTASASDTYRNCQKRGNAVVTIYAGREIGSGSVIRPDGVVITNHHVIQEVVRSQSKKPIYINFIDGTQFVGKLLSTDTKNDLALVQIQANQQFPTVPIATVAQARSGEPVCAIGSPFGRRGVLSQGKFDGYRENGDLRSSVLLFPGNSGGPLLNAEGSLIGVNKSIWQSSSGRNTGISFAVSAQSVKAFAARSGFPISEVPSGGFGSTVSQQSTPQPSDPSLVLEPDALTSAARLPQPEANSVRIPVPQPPIAPSNPVTVEAARSPGRLGVIINAESLTIQQIEIGSNAAIAGLLPGDQLLAVNGRRLGNLPQLQALLRQQPPSAVFTVQRGQERMEVSVNFR